MPSEAKPPSSPSRSTDLDQLSRVRERFTRTAEQFARFALRTRAEEAQHLVEMTAPRGSERALDLACGPGTFALAFAPRVRWILGVDLTPAMLARAREALAESGLDNAGLACGDGTALPVRDAGLDLAVCGYCFHHMPEPAQALSEMARVVCPGGRIAAVDLIVPEGADSAANNRIERARDASHAETLTAARMKGFVEATGLRVTTAEITERRRDFDDWMQIAGWTSEDPACRETRRLMEASIANDAAGFHPRVTAAGGLEFVQTTLFVVAEKTA